jgi:hypothetical protein
VEGPERPVGPPLSAEELAAAAGLWRKNGRELRAVFGGSSMEPSLPAQSEVVLRCGAPPTVGDIVAFVADGRIVLHRVEAVSRGEGALLTRGDALWLPDAPVRDPDAILGVVTAVRRGDRLAPPPPAPRRAARRLALWPFRAALAASPVAAALAVRVSRGFHRTFRAATEAVKRRISDPRA